MFKHKTKDGKEIPLNGITDSQRIKIMIKEILRNIRKDN